MTWVVELLSSDLVQLGDNPGTLACASEEGDQVSMWERPRRGIPNRKESSAVRYTVGAF